MAIMLGSNPRDKGSNPLRPVNVGYVYAPSIKHFEDKGVSKSSKYKSTLYYSQMCCVDRMVMYRIANPKSSLIRCIGSSPIHSVLLKFEKVQHDPR